MIIQLFGLTKRLISFVIFYFNIRRNFCKKILLEFST